MNVAELKQELEKYPNNMKKKDTMAKKDSLVCDVDLIEGQILYFEPRLGLYMHKMNSDDVLMGDSVKIIRRTRRGTYIGEVLRTGEQFGGFIKSDFKEQKTDRLWR